MLRRRCGSPKGRAPWTGRDKQSHPHPLKSDCHASLAMTDKYSPSPLPSPLGERAGVRGSICPSLRAKRGNLILKDEDEIAYLAPSMGLDPSGCRTFVAAFNFCCPAKIVVAYAPLNDCTAKAVGLRSANPTYSTNKRRGLKTSPFLLWRFLFLKNRGHNAKRA